MSTDTTEDLFRPHPNATALTAVRIVNGELCTYTVAEAEQGWAAIERTLRTAHTLGYVRRSSADPKSGYAVLDVLDDNDDILHDYEIPTATAWEWWCRHLGLRATPAS